MNNNHKMPNAEPDSTSQLKSIFDQSLAVLSENKTNAKPLKGQKIRNLRLTLPIHVDPVNLQKRALDEAAKALTSLWNISDPRRARLPGRPLPSNR